MTSRHLAIAATIALALTAAAHGERIRAFDARVVLDANGTCRFEERIAWDFERESRHGIYREIPVWAERAETGGFDIGLSVDGVDDGAGNERPYQTSTVGTLTRIRIGDPDRTVTGRQDYRIRYRVERAVLRFPDHDELYWNVTGTEWAVPIDEVGMKLTVPSTLGNRPLEVACYTGPAGSREKACTIHVEGTTVDVAATRPLGPHEGLTIAVGFPQGVVAEPSPWRRAIWWLRDTGAGWLMLPLAVAAAMGAAWRRYGRDPGGAAAITVRYEPPGGLTPAEVGTIVDERAQHGDVTATIIDLAVRRWLTIEEISTSHLLFFSTTDYKLTRLADPGGQRLKAHEATLLTALFSGRQSVLVSDLRDRFHHHLSAITNGLYGELSSKERYFAGRPDRTRASWIGVGIALGVIGIMGNAAWGPIAMGSCIVSGVIVALAGRLMPRRTARGRAAYDEILGFKEFLSRVEADRLARAGTRTVETFERFLPYAIVLGVADHWAEAFADIYTAPPSWYRGDFDADHFGTRDLVRNLGQSMDTMTRTMASTPSSSGGSGSGGGGSSGGGLGGGGGGSW